MSGTTLPTITPDVGSVTEDEVLVLTGNVLANDVDPNGTLSLVSVNGTAVSGTTTIIGTYGTLVIQPNGQYTYTLNNTSATVRALVNAKIVPDVFTYVATDGTTYTQATTQTIQNLITQSEAFNDPSWVKYTSGGAAPVITANTQAGPNGGTATADQVALSSGNSGLYFKTNVSGSYTFSVWVKLVSGSGVFELAYYAGSTNTISQVSETATGNWQRFTFTFTGDGNANSNVSFGEVQGQATTGTFELYGAQLNSGATAETYLPTTGSAATSTVSTTTNVVLSSTLTVGVTGNTPVANPDTGAVIENGTLTSAGNLLANDTDGAGKTLTVASVGGTTIATSGTTTITGTYGTLSVQANGAYTYTLNNTAANVQALAAAHLGCQVAVVRQPRRRHVLGAAPLSAQTHGPRERLLRVRV